MRALVPAALRHAGERSRQVRGAEHRLQARRAVRARTGRERVVPDPIVASVIQASQERAPLAVTDRRRGRTPRSRSPRSLSADAELEGYFNPVTEIVVGPGASVNYLCVQDLSEQSGSSAASAQGRRDASLHWVGLGLGSRQGKLRMETDINGEGASARVTGAYVGQGSQHLDYDTTQEHAAPHTTSDLAFRGILRDRATAVWSGMIKVDPGAQRTDAFQESRNLLLSDGAHADAIPASRSRPTTCAARTQRPSRGSTRTSFLDPEPWAHARRGRAPPGRRLPPGDRGPARGLAVPARPAQAALERELDIVLG